MSTPKIPPAGGETPPPKGGIAFLLSRDYFETDDPYERYALVVDLRENEMALALERSRQLTLLAGRQLLVLRKRGMTFKAISNALKARGIDLSESRVEVLVKKAAAVRAGGGNPTIASAGGGDSR